VIDLPKAIAAVGALGTAAFGLVDATKPIFHVNSLGFSGIRNAVTPLIPGDNATNSLAASKILDTLEANWMNGTDLTSQKAIAKSLIKLHLVASNAEKVATACGVDSAVLTSIATKTSSGVSMTQTESDVFGRFDLIVTALLDEAYQRADQSYRNGTRLVAMLFAVVLAVLGAFAAHVDMGVAIIIGLLATPLAPIAKDLSSALATAVNALQSVKK
jgi:hypothetical protein